MEPRKSCLIFLKTLFRVTIVMHNFLMVCWPGFSDVTTESSHSSSVRRDLISFKSKSVACINEK